jgi:hypothetical protein
LERFERIIDPADGLQRDGRSTAAAWFRGSSLRMWSQVVMISSVRPRNFSDSFLAPGLEVPGPECERAVERGDRLGVHAV